MSGLGGAILGHDGLSALQAEPGLAVGEGLEGFPDGVVAVPVSTADLFYDFSNGSITAPASTSAIAEGLTIHNEIPFELFTAGSQGYARVNRPFSDPADGDKTGFWSSADEAQVRPDLADFDLRLTFIWLSDADLFNQRMMVSVMDSAVSVDGEAPYAAGPIDDRNNNRYLADYDSAFDTTGTTVLTNGNGVTGLSGSELTADGATEHTAGIQVEGTTWRFFFDGAMRTQITLVAAERTRIDNCRRIGQWWPSVVFNADTTAFRLLEYSALGDLW